MRQVTQQLLDNLRTGFKTDFKRGLDKVKPSYRKFSTVVTSSTKIETYGWLTDFPRFRKWVGPKVFKRMGEKVYQLVNEAYENSLKVHKHQVADDNLGLFPAMFEGWGEEAAALPDRLAYDALAAGHMRECYDGQNFFDTDHPVGEGVASNMSAAGGAQPWFLMVTTRSLKPILIQEREKPHFHMITNMEDSGVAESGEYPATGEARYGAGYTYWQLCYRSTQPLNEANYKAAFDAMLAYTDDEGEPLEIMPDTIVVGRSNRQLAKELFEKANLAGGESNINYKDVEILFSQRLP